MRRKDRIFEVLKELSQGIEYEDLLNGNIEINATVISDITKLDRSNVSRDLNSLVKEKKAIKFNGRPVYFMEKSRVEKILGVDLKDKSVFDSVDEILSITKKEEKLSDPFDNIIGHSDSLELIIKQAKAAVLYPPNGLYTLITGDTGVGKTTFAETMYMYALGTGKIEKDGKFAVFNCSEYADNPQLILSQLFGHIQGAFTGADQDKEGLIDKANGGVLFLDEIHRLPPEGQEMLFVLMDKQKYRRLGETENFRDANVRIIGATTEDIRSTLLSTFMRRIPVVIKLPKLSDRSLEERFMLIKSFFKEEANNVQVPIKVYKNVIESLLLYECEGNIGQLKADIQLLCARGFLEYKTFNKKEIEIDTPILPDNIYRGLLDSEKRREKNLNLIEFNADEFHIFTSSHTEKVLSIDNYKISDNLYEEIAAKYNSYVEKGFSSTEINETISCEIEKYIRKLLGKSQVEEELLEKDELFKIVSPRVYNAVQIAITTAETKLGNKFTEEASIGLALHISGLIERIYEGKITYSSEINQVVLNNPEEFKVAKLMIKIIEEELEISIPPEEIGFLTMFLTAMNHKTITNKKIGCIILSHGKSMATSMAEVVNELLGTAHCRGIDMPLDAKVEDILKITIETVKELDEGKGVLLLVDMGTLTAFSEIITKKTGIETYSLEMVSTPIALEAARKCLLPDMNLKKLVNELSTISPYMGRNLTNSTVRKRIEESRKVILTVCITGKGCAIKIAELIRSNLPEIEENNIELIPIGIQEIDRIIENLNNESKEIIAIVGSMDPKIGIPFVSLNEIILGKGLEKLNKIVNEVNNYHYKNQYVYKKEEKWDMDAEIYIELLERTLNFLNPIKAYEVSCKSLNYISNALKITINEGIKIGYIVHCSCMVERLLSEEPLPYKNIDKRLKKEPILFKIVKESMEIYEQSFGIEVNDTEIGYVMDLINTNMQIH